MNLKGEEAKYREVKGREAEVQENERTSQKVKKPKV